MSTKLTWRPISLVQAYCPRRLTLAVESCIGVPHFQAIRPVELEFTFDSLRCSECEDDPGLRNDPRHVHLPNNLVVTLIHPMRAFISDPIRDSHVKVRDTPATRVDMGIRIGSQVQSFAAYSRTFLFQGNMIAGQRWTAFGCRVVFSRRQSKYKYEWMLKQSRTVQC